MKHQSTNDKLNISDRISHPLLCMNGPHELLPKAVSHGLFTVVNCRLLWTIAEQGGALRRIPLTSRLG